MNIYAIGSTVKLFDISGKVSGVAIYPDGVQYRIVWWNGRERKEEWVHSFEITLDEGNRATVGFSGH